jgi:CRISPR-associated protein Cmr4
MKQHRLFLYALDPTHIGAGGYRLGRVDNTILRDAATGLPKIPGSSINGTTRAAAIYSFAGKEQQQAMAYANYMLRKDEFKRDRKRPHDGKEDPVAKVFGYAEGDDRDEQGNKGTSHIGIVSFRDAEILAFPVPTLSGPRWVTTSRLLTAAGCRNVPTVTDAAHILVQATVKYYARLNLGWMLLGTKKAEIPLPEGITADIKNNLVLVHEELFPSIVNANLETRTSVAIDFETGAGAEGALFTYEATPRGTVYLGQIDFDDDRFPQLYSPAFDLVNRALKLACQLGLGGMTTRGFGRMQPNLVEMIETGV